MRHTLVLGFAGIPKIHRIFFHFGRVFAPVRLLEGIPIFLNFLYHFCSILAPFWHHFGSILVHFGSICFPRGVMGTGSRNMHEMSRFWDPPGLPFGRYFRSKNHKKSDQNVAQCLNTFFIDFETQSGSKNPPKTLKN